MQGKKRKSGKEQQQMQAQRVVLAAAFKGWFLMLDPGPIGDMRI